jgi:predicted phosphate transport protein (TIGR00153 family)
MKKTIQGALANLFGPSRNDQYAALLKRLADIAQACAVHFRKTNGQDAEGIIAFEHQADSVVDEIHELLDNSFIMRFDIPDAMRLTDVLDDVVDGMRKVALHIQAYKPYLSELRPEAHELMEVAADMLLHVDKLVMMLAESRLSLQRVRAEADIIDELESKADRLVSGYERNLVNEFGGTGKDALGFIAWHQLFHLLEQITDDANHCARQILSLARKEA